MKIYPTRAITPSNRALGLEVIWFHLPQAKIFLDIDATHNLSSANCKFLFDPAMFLRPTRRFNGAKRILNKMQYQCSQFNTENIKRKKQHGNEKTPSELSQLYKDIPTFILALTTALQHQS